MDDDSGSFIEWLVPFAFILCSGWATWHTPAFLLDLLPPASESMTQQLAELHHRKDVTPDMAGLFGGYADALDWLSVVLVPILLIIGMRTVRCAHMEYDYWRAIDRFALFIGRVTMLLILSLTCIMLYEVFLRYLFEAPTLWANELTLWIAGYVFLLSGLYAMQQRCHIRIFLLYDVVPRWLQHVFDIISVAFVWFFAFFLVFGSFKQVFVAKFYKWEMFGTAFDPPIPATIQPMILIMVVLIAIQAATNLIADWNLTAEERGGLVDIDEQELEAIKRSVGKV